MQSTTIDQGGGEQAGVDMETDGKGLWVPVPTPTGPRGSQGEKEKTGEWRGQKSLTKKKKKKLEEQNIQ